ncbi:MAG: hypothetical protein DIU71_03830 [Proteobacteria bacterium]|nr:MAG: hypothetical protein DIU71_03830 [Pseudomonadota bacterium]
MKSILVLFHCASNTGYAIATLEKVFFEMARALVGGDEARIHFGYPSMARGPSPAMPDDFRQYLVLDTRSKDPDHRRQVHDYLRRHEIDTIFGFDQPVSMPMYRHLRRAGIERFVSYWGAPMSSVFGPIKRSLKRLEVALRRHGPDHYIFESYGMAETAIRGRGIPRRKVSVVHLGVDTEVFRPDPADADYPFRELGICRSRKIFFFSGHMEPRKGVRTIMRAARILAERRRQADWHMLLLGNAPGEERRLLAELGGNKKAREHVTFGGYRHDLARIHRGCYAGIIASTGWDSLTMSSIEMQSSGLPLLLSNLPGLNEAIEDGVSGLLFPPGDALALANTIERLLDDPALRERLAQGARQRVESRFTKEIQHHRLVELMRRLT